LYEFCFKFVYDSKESFQFLACFISYYRFVKNNKEFRTPILFDATCSGVQHLSALTKDKDIGKLVNLTQSEHPSDFYQYCTKVFNSQIPNLKNKIIQTKLEKINLIRKVMKPLVMTIPYNVTLIGMVVKLEEFFDKLLIPLSALQKIGIDSKNNSSLALCATNLKQKK
jgi:DNA-directed RNA polymerase